MEGKPHRSDAYIPAGQISRMKEDLLLCTNDFLSSFQQRGEEKCRTFASERPHVAIVGAGLAGLRCAEVLISKGVKVTILEARQRIGGRIHQENLLGRDVDMGPNWIHGTSNNPIVKLAKETGTPLVSIDDNTRVYDPQGSLISSEETRTGFERVWDLISDAFKHSNNDSSTIPSSRSLKDFFHERLSEQSLSHKEQNLILLLAEIWGSFIGDPWEKQSLKWFWLEECLDGDNLFIADSHKAILQRVAQSVLANGDVRLGTVVETIENITTGSGAKVLVKANNFSFEFDEVVVAVPLGCLKRGKPAFIPALPATLRNAFNNASYSSLEKVYIAFPVDFWGSTHPEPGLSEGHIPSTGSQLPSFFQFLSPDYVPDQQKLWTIELAPLSSSAHFGNEAQPTLLFTLYGPCAAHVTSLIRQLSPTSPQYYNTLIEFFRPYYSLLPNYRANHPDCIPSAALATNWQNDDLAGNGSYTNFQVSSDASGGEVLLDGDVRAMRSGIPERGIWFAGEHTAPFIALGTSTGAYWSGESVGVKILVAKGLL